MYQTILLPLDGSELAERPIPYVDQLAKAHGARVVLLRVIPIPTFSAEDPQLMQSRQIYEAERYLAQVAQLFDPATNLDLMVVSGDSADIIGQQVQAHSCDLIVMSTHGRSGIGRWIYGSVADAVMREATVPVLLVPARSAPRFPQDRPLRVLVSIDGSARARAAIRPASQLAGAQGVEIHVVRVIVPLNYGYADGATLLMYDPAEELAAATADLSKVADDARASGQEVVVHCPKGPAAAMITATAAEIGADLIAMSTHGSGGMTRLVLGSVATSVVQQATVPILIVRSDTAG